MSFRAKLTLVFVGLQILVVAVILVAGVRYAGENLRLLESRRVTSQMDLLVATIREPLLIFDYGTVSTLAKALSESGGFSRVAVFTPGGVSIVSEETLPVSVPNQDVFRDLAAKLLEPARTLVTRDVALAGQFLGRVDIEPNLDPAIERLSGMIRSGLIVGALGILILGAAVWWTGMWLSRRLMILSDGAIQIAKGDGNFRLKLPGNDEISDIAVSINSMADGLIQKSISAARLARTDALTGLFNRKGFFEALEELNQKAKPLAVLHVDIDRFKIINDSRGQAAGDAVLKAVAGHIEQLMVEYDGVLARIGSDEFVVAISAEDPQDTAVRLGNRIVSLANQSVPYKDVMLRVGLSVGIAQIDSGPHDEAALARLTEDADIALYQAKTSGRGRIALYEHSARQERESEAKLEAEVVAALGDTQFVPFVQPQIDIRTGEVVGAEILARWNHPVQGIVQPGEFLGKLRNASLSDVIDDVVRDLALTWMASANGAARPVHISLNLTQVQLIQPDFAQKFMERVGKFGVDVSQVALEVHEDVVIDQDPAVARNLGFFKDWGFIVELDDFGTGNASLRTLSQLSVDRLKLDHGFITRIFENQTNQAIVRSVADIAHSLGIEVIAEGVETQEEMDILREFGISIMQGYYFARPMGLQQFETWYCEHRSRNLDVAALAASALLANPAR